MKIVLYVFLALLALAFLILLLPAYLYIRYEECAEVSARILGVKLRLYPMKKKKKQKKKQEKELEPSKEEKEKSKEKKKHPSLAELSEYAQMGIVAIGRICRCIRITKLHLHARIGDEDAGKTAMAYGSSAAALSVLLPIIESSFRVKNVDIDISADFGGQNIIKAEIAFSSIVLCLFIAALKIGIRFMKIKNKYRGGKRNG